MTPRRATPNMASPHEWPHRHPGIVIDAVEWVDCRAERGTSTKEPGWSEAVAEVAHRHQVADNDDHPGRTSR
jgi:hypothetical protein